ncbi:MAG: multifunctional CCA addition/repair protein [Gammaproteobacteria bacterium]|nr:MAG: multifunctional CCA addition/repair protein [Gammaproteobacteria bacterium]
MKTYLVGGAVRDQLLGLTVKDKDWVVVGGSPEAMLNQGFKQVGATFPVFLHPDTKEEYALARTEQKQGTGYKGFRCFFSADVSLEQDLKRRDLTINAMARDHNGTIIDPYGGQKDLAAKRLRHVSPAFAEDPLRILRVARFAARFHDLGFTIADETIEMMQRIVASGEVAQLTPERVWQETERALAETRPGIYFQVLRSIGALAVLMPELDVLFGVPQPEQYHPEIDSGRHSLMALEIACQLTADTKVRFAALVHDLGKGLTPKECLPKHIGHERAGVKPIQAMCQRLRIPNEFRDMACLASEYHLIIHRAFELTPKTILKVIKNCHALRRPRRFGQLLMVCEADARGRAGMEKNRYPQSTFFANILDTLAKVTIRDLIEKGLTGSQLGQAIHARQIRQIKEAVANQRLTRSGSEHETIENSEYSEAKP